MLLVWIRRNTCAWNSKAAAARKPRKQALFLKALTETVNVTLSCRKAGVPRRTVYDWREADAAFADRWDEALEEGIDLLEAEVHRRAFEGVERPVYYKGERVGEWRHYSDGPGDVPAEGAPAGEVPGRAQGQGRRGGGSGGKDGGGVGDTNARPRPTGR